MYYSSDAICTNCGFITKSVRTDNFNKRKYYPFTTTCLSCGQITTFIELGDASLVKKKLEYSTQLTELEERIFELLKKPKCKVKTK